MNRSERVCRSSELIDSEGKLIQVQERKIAAWQRSDALRGRLSDSNPTPCSELRSGEDGGSRICSIRFRPPISQTVTRRKRTSSTTDADRARRPAGPTSPAKPRGSAENIGKDGLSRLTSGSKA